ncbi:MAG: hypothetical protein IKI75_01450 [Lachnospiraceae bacterium]|nr:hypothetical protein [Lachnospiraceae bacterium]
MKASERSRLALFFATVAIAVVWIILMLIFTDFDEAGFYYWGGLAFGIIAFAITCLALLMMHIHRNRSTTEITMLSGYILEGYALISCIVNTIFCVIRDGDHGKILVAVNLILMLVFGIIFAASLNYNKRVAELADNIDTRTAPVANYSSRIAGIVAMAQDPAVKAALLKLKESVDYGSNMSRGYAEAGEREFSDKLDIIQNLVLAGNTPADQLIGEIEQAKRLYAMRNAQMQTL